jgi:hypothetical protein
MPNDNSDLWPPDLVVDVLSPVMILNEQAEVLAKRTKGIVKGEVLPGVAGKFEQISFDIVAPAAGVRQRILRVRYSKEYPYPVVLIAPPLERGSFEISGTESDQADPTQWKLAVDESIQARVAYTPNDVREFLKRIFNAPTTRAALFSLVARSNEVTGGVRGGIAQDRNDTSKSEE